MSIIKKLKKWNRLRNFTIKKIKLYVHYLPPIILDWLLARKSANITQPIKRILLIRNDAIGDMVVTTGLIRKLSQAGYQVYVSSTKPALEIIRYNPYISGTFLYNDSSFSQFFRSIQEVRKQRFDLAIELKVSRNLSVYYPLYHGLLKTNILLGFNQPEFHTFNQIINYKISNTHVTDLFKPILTYLGIKNQDLSYELFTSEDTEHYVSAHLTGEKFAVVNPQGGKQARCLSKTQTEAICDLLVKYGYHPIIIGEPNRIKKLNISNYTIFPSRTILDIVSLIRQSNLIISVDTSAVHIAAAFNIRTIALYLEDIHPLLDTITLSSITDFYQELDINWIKFQRLAHYHLLNYTPQEQYDFFTNNSIFWHPNNQNATQIIFPELEISAVTTPILIDKISKPLALITNHQYTIKL